MPIRACSNHWWSRAGGGDIRHTQHWQVRLLCFVTPYNQRIFTLMLPHGVHRMSPPQDGTAGLQGFRAIQTDCCCPRITSKRLSDFLKRNKTGFKTYVWVTSEMTNKTHIKHTISVPPVMVNFLLKYLCDWFRLSQVGSFSRNFCTFHVHGLFTPKWNLQNLERNCWILEETERKNAWVLLETYFCHYFCMLPLLQIGFGNHLGLGLCSWRCKVSPLFAQNAGCQWIIENSLNF